MGYSPGPAPARRAARVLQPAGAATTMAPGLPGEDGRRAPSARMP